MAIKSDGYLACVVTVRHLNIKSFFLSHHKDTLNADNLREHHIKRDDIEISF